MAIQSFSVGQVLTASQVNALQANDYNQTVSNKTASYTLVAADKGTRIAMSSTSATTITVNTGLFSAGDTLFIQNLNSGVSTITAGTATVTTSASLALAQWEGGTLYFTSTSAAIFIKGAGAAASASGANWTLLNAGGTALTGAQTITVSGISGKDKIAIVVTDASSASASSTISIRLNTDTGANYYTYGNRNTASTVYSSDNIRGWAAGSDQNSIRLGVMSATSAATVYGFCLLTGCNSSGLKMLQATGGGLPDGSNSQQIYNIGGYYDSSSTISSISVFSASGNFDAGTVYVYTSA